MFGVFKLNPELAAAAILASILPELQVLSRKLQALADPDKALEMGLSRWGLSDYYPYIAEGPMMRLVRFFDYVSKWHDRVNEIDEIIAGLESGLGWGNHFDAKLQALRALKAHFINAGRCVEGLNRTKPGEQVTAQKVYLGNIYGLWTFTVASWHAGASPDEPRTGFPHDVCQGMTSRDVINRQARNFMNGHVPRMIELIERLSK